MLDLDKGVFIYGDEITRAIQLRCYNCNIIFNVLARHLKHHITKEHFVYCSKCKDACC